MGRTRLELTIVVSLVKQSVLYRAGETVPRDIGFLTEMIEPPRIKSIAGNLLAHKPTQQIGDRFCARRPANLVINNGKLFAGLEQADHGN
jgi:hypothetical protein